MNRYFFFWNGVRHDAGTFASFRSALVWIKRYRLDIPGKTRRISGYETSRIRGITYQTTRGELIIEQVKQ